MKDLTKGKVGPVILRFMLPIAVGMIIQLFYTLTDTRIVGRYIGKEALAAVTSTTALSNLLVGFLNGLASGFALSISSSFGMKDFGRLKKSVGNAVTLGFCTAIILTVGSLLFLDPILVLLKVQPQHMELAKAYIGIILLGLVGSVMYNICAGILRAIGDSVTPLIFLIISAILNIGMDLLFVMVFQMGVSGAAFATIIAQCLSFILCAIYMVRRYEILRISVSDLQLSPNLCSQLVKDGLSMGLMSSLVNCGTLILQSGINNLGEDYILAHTGARRLTEIYMIPFASFGMTMATFSAQNYGANQKKRVWEGFKCAVLYTWIWDCAMILFTWTLARYLVAFIIATDSELIISTAIRYLKFDTAFYFLCTVICLGRNVLQGVNIRITPVISSLLELGGKCIAVWLFVPMLQYDGVILAEPFSWIIMVIPLLCSLIPFIKKIK